MFIRTEGKLWYDDSAYIYGTGQNAKMQANSAIFEKGKNQGPLIHILSPISNCPLSTT